MRSLAYNNITQDTGILSLCVFSLLIRPNEVAAKLSKQRKGILKQQENVFKINLFLFYLRNKISFFEVHWDMNCSWSRDQIL